MTISGIFVLYSYYNMSIPLFFAILFLSSVLLSTIVLYILLNKSLAREKKCIDWMITTEKDISDTYDKLKSIDDRQIFEKDDEVGFVFTELVTTLEKLNEKIKNVNQQTQED